jgi:antitoxin component of MazEF toxin-antitoxin module
MKTKLIRIGNSRGVRIPGAVLALYRLEEGAVMELCERREGILLRPAGDTAAQLDWESAYQEMACSEEGFSEEWDVTTGDGIDA